MLVAKSVGIPAGKPPTAYGATGGHPVSEEKEPNKNLENTQSMQTRRFLICSDKIIICIMYAWNFVRVGVRRFNRPRDTCQRNNIQRKASKTPSDGEKRVPTDQNANLG